jgi:hypothetical protein
VLIAQNQANVNATTENFRAFSATLRDELPLIAEKMNRLADDLNEVVYENRDNAQASLANIRELSEKRRTATTNADHRQDRRGRGRSASWSTTRRPLRISTRPWGRSTPASRRWRRASGG